MLKKLYDEDVIKASDSKITKFNIAHEYNAHSFIVTTGMKGNLVVSDRELIMFYTNQTLSDGSRVLIAFSVDSDKVTLDANWVLAKAIIWAFHIEEVSEDRCKVTAINHVDPGGSIPTMFINTMVGLRHTQFVNLKKIAETS